MTDEMTTEMTDEMTAEMTKHELKKSMRRKLRAHRQSLPEAERANLSEIIVRKFLAHEIYQKAQIVMAYMSMPEEVQLRDVFMDAFSCGKTMAVPFIVGKGEMLPVSVSNFGELGPGAFGIQTVLENLRKFIDADKIDCVIVPGAAFDVHGNRLGLGGGFYDVFLKKAVNAKRVALAFDFQLLDEIPAESHDMPVDLIITENRIIEAERS